MSRKTLQLSFFIALTLLLIVVSFFIFKPYLGVIFLSGVLAVVFYPLYQKFISWLGGRQALSAALIVLVIILVIVVPSVLIAEKILGQAINLYNSVAFGEANNLLIAADNAFSKMGQELLGQSFQFSFEEYLQGALNWVISHFDSFLSAVFEGLFSFVLMIISLYYLLQRGSNLKEHIKTWSPLPDRYDEDIIETLHSSMDAVFRGRFLISVAQGFFLWLGFLIFGISNSALWGFVGAIASLIPVLGTSLVTVPAIIYLFAAGNIGAAIGMILWAAIAVGFIDNAISLVFFKRSIKIHPLIILFSILGGVELFGPIGFLAGPVLISALLSLLKVYPFLLRLTNERAGP